MSYEPRESESNFKLPYYALRILPFVVILLTGISLWDQPQRELLYSYDVNEHCFSDYCVVLHSIELGNTGKDDIALVTVALRSRALSDLLLDPAVRKFGKISIPFERTENGEETEIRFGPIERGKNIVISFSTRTDSVRAHPESDVIARISAGDTPVLRGDANSTRFGRVITGIVELF